MRFLFLALLSASGFFAFPAFSACAACGADMPTRIDISYLVTSGSLEAEMNDTLKITQENGERRYSLYSAAGQLMYANNAREGKQYWYVSLNGSLVGTRERVTATAAITTDRRFLMAFRR